MKLTENLSDFENRFSKKTLNEFAKELEKYILESNEKYYEEYTEPYFTPMVEFSNIEDIKEDNTSKQKYTIQWEKEKL